LDFSGFAPYGEQRPELGVSRKPEYEPTEGEADARSPRSCPEPFELVGLKVWETFHKASSQGEESGSKARTPWLLVMGSLRCILRHKVPARTGSFLNPPSFPVPAERRWAIRRATLL